MISPEEIGLYLEGNVLRSPREVLFNTNLNELKDVETLSAIVTRSELKKEITFSMV
jgi:hypothetical protein